MNLLFLLDRYPGCGGIERVTTVLANAFCGRGHAVHILSRKAEDPELLESLDARVTIHQLPSLAWQEAQNIAYLKALCSDQSIEIVLNQESYSGAIDLLMKLELPGVSIVTAEHNSPDALSRQLAALLAGERLTFSPRSWIKRLARPLILGKTRAKERREHLKYLEFSDRHVLLSQRFLPVLEQVSGRAAPPNVRWIPNALDNAEPALPSDSSRKKQVIYVGRLIREQKRVDRLLWIWKAIEVLRPEWELVVVGDGPDRVPLESMAQELGLQNIRFEGFKSDVASCYAQAKLLVLTSEVEGLPMVLPEAMSYGVVPVLYDSFASAADVVEHGATGLLIPPFDKDAFVAGLISLMDDPTLLAKMSGNARKKAMAYSLGSILERWEALFQEVIEEQKHKGAK